MSHLGLMRLEYTTTHALRVVVTGIHFSTPAIGIHRQSFDHIIGIPKLGLFYMHVFVNLGRNVDARIGEVG